MSLITEPERLEYHLSKVEDSPKMIDATIYVLESMIVRYHIEDDWVNSFIQSFASIYQEEDSYRYYHKQQNKLNSISKYPKRYQVEYTIAAAATGFSRDRNIIGDISSRITPLLKDYVLNSMFNILRILTSAQLYQEEMDTLESEIQFLLHIIESKKLNDIEIVIARDAIDLIQNADRHKFENLLDKLIGLTHNLDHYSVGMIFNCLQNLSVIHKSAWNIDDAYILNLYKIQYQKFPEVFLALLKPQAIKNIATLAIRSSDKKWFDEVFTPKLVSKLSQKAKNAFRLCTIKFDFDAQAYKACLERIATFSSDDIFQDLELRRLQIMCFYELGERVLVDNYLNTFKIFIYRNEEINKMYKESNNNFMRMLNKLNKSIDVKKVDSTAEEIQAVNRIAEKQWLLDKASELKQKLTSSHG